MTMMLGKYEGGAAGDKTVELAVDELGRLILSPGSVGGVAPGYYDTVAGNIAAVGQAVAIDVTRASNVAISMVATGLAGHNAVFEYSHNSTDGVDGNWYAVQAIRSNANTVETGTGVLAGTPVYGWELSVNAYRWFRVRAAAHTGGTAAYTLQPAGFATEPIPAAQVTPTQPVSLSGANLPTVGQGAEDAAAAGNAVRVGGRVRAAALTTLVANDAADLTLTTGGAAVVKAYSVPELDWHYVAPAGGIVVATAVAAKAAVVGLRNYVTGVDLYNASASVTTEVVLLDGVTPIWRTSLAPGQRLDRQFASPRKTSVNVALNVQALTAGVLYANIDGYVAL